MRAKRVWGRLAGAAVLATVLTLGAGSTTPHTASATERLENGNSSETSGPDAVAGRVQIAPASMGQRDVRAAQQVAAMSTREKAASIVMGHIPTTDPVQLRDYIERTGIGGFIMMGGNVPATESELRALTEALTLDAALPPLIAIDQEGGDVSRLPWDHFASTVTLKSAPTPDAERAFAGRGALVQRAGIGVNFGIVADVTDQSGSFIARRSMGWPPEAAAVRVAAAVAGEGQQTLSTLKHFPGHGAAPGDSHAMIPSADITYDQWRATDARPFAAGIEAGAPLVMFGHLAFPLIDAAPASLSAEWHRILREDFRFRGVAVTDDLGMLQASGIPEYRDAVANAIAALNAGNDLILGVMFSNAQTADAIVSGITTAVESGAVSPERLDEAAVRVYTLRMDVAGAGRGMTRCDDCTPAG